MIAERCSRCCVFFVSLLSYDYLLHHTPTIFLQHHNKQLHHIMVRCYFIAHRSMWTFLSMMRGPRACPLSQRVSECRTVHAVKQSTAPDTCKRLTNILPLLVLLCVLSLFNKDTTYLRGKLLCALIIDYNIIIMILHSPSLTKMEATPSLPEEVTNDVGR